MLFRSDPPEPSGLGPSDRAELRRAQEKHVRLLGRADQAIREAMAHADEVFLPYRGPERRGKGR